MTGDAPRILFAKIMAAGKPLGEVVEGHMYYGVKTGLNEAFLIDQSTRDKLMRNDPACASILKPLVRGEDLRPWYQEDEGRWLICLPSGWTMKTFPDMTLLANDTNTRIGRDAPFGCPYCLYRPFFGCFKTRKTGNTGVHTNLFARAGQDYTIAFIR